MKAVLFVCLLAAAGIWAWALFWPGEPPTLPDELVGRYRLVRYEPGQAAKDKRNPFQPNQTQIFELRPDATYLRQQLVLGDVEMRRAEGLLRLHGERQIEFVRVSTNRAPADPEEERQLYAYRWQRTPEGRLLLLTHFERGFELYLRRE